MAMPPRPVPAVVLRSARKRYRSTVALDGLDLTVGRGEAVALVGANGSGKSTALEVVLGLARLDAGAVTVLGEPPGGPVRSRVGAMLQGGGLPEHMTAVEVVRLVGRSYPRAFPARDVLARVGLAGRERSRVGELSGGQRRRVQLAVALVGAPELLVLDEPTAAMDVASRGAFARCVRRHVEGGGSTLFATHDLEEAAAVADRVVVLHRGRTAHERSTGELDVMRQSRRSALLADLDGWSESFQREAVGW
jgi:ABC-2 type transport system ATP-binding protein